MTETEYYINMRDISERISASCEQAYILGAHANEVKYRKLVTFVTKIWDLCMCGQNKDCFCYEAKELLQELGENI